MLTRKYRYEIDLGIIGERNSYSKTYKEATFMRMKDDYMRNGQLKPGHNLQISNENPYTLAYAVFSNFSDSKTMTPFQDKIEEEFFELPKHIVADAGYGSEPNYNDILVKRQKTTPLITYGQYLREQKRSYKNIPFQTANWTYDETANSYECLNSKLLNFSHKSVPQRQDWLRTPFQSISNQKTVVAVHSDHSVQGHMREPIEQLLSMSLGKSKKNM